MDALSSLPVSTFTTSKPQVDRATAAQAVAATQLALQESVITSIGQSGSSTSTYSAAGLLNQIVSAGQAPSTPPTLPQAGTDLSQYVLNSAAQSVVDTLTQDPTASGFYTPGGGIVDNGTSGNWAEVLKQRPALASAVIGESEAQSIISTINTSA